MESKKMTIKEMWHFVLFQTKNYGIVRVAIVLSAIFAASVGYINYIMYSKVLEKVMAGLFDDAISTTVVFSAALCVASLISHSSRAVFIHYAEPAQFEIKRRTVFKTYSIQYDKVEEKHALDALRNIKNGEMGMGGVYIQLNDILDYFESVFSVIYAVIFMVVLALKARIIGDGIGLTIVLGTLLAIVFALTLFLNGIISNILGRKINNINKNNEKFNALGQYILGLISRDDSLKEIRLNTMEDYLLKKVWFITKGSEMFTEHGRVAGKYVGLQSFVLQLFSGYAYAFIAVEALLGAIPIADIIMYGGAIITLNLTIQNMIKTKIYIDYRNGFMSQYETYINSPDMDYDGTLPIEKRDDNNYSLEFKNVWFKYDEAEDYVLKDFSLKFNMGEKLAIVGLNGAGKTTIIKLLCRLYNPESGEILLNGINIKKYDYEEYTRIFSVVFQDFALFDFPLDENVAGSEYVDEERFDDAIKKVGLAGRISELPEGRRTVLGHENGEGVSLSGGEGQKLAIARALYKDAPFIILDEPTAALDPIAESEIYENFDGLIKDKTAIYISHRMSSCKFCDRIVVIEGGGILEEGNHRSLLARKGRYAELYNTQATHYA